MRRLELTPQARADASDYATWLQERSPAAASRLTGNLIATFSLFRRFPMTGRSWARTPRSLRGMRAIAVTGSPELVVLYRVDRRTVVILRVLHGARDIDTMLRSSTV